MMTPIPSRAALYSTTPTNTHAVCGNAFVHVDLSDIQSFRLSSPATHYSSSLDAFAVALVAAFSASRISKICSMYL